MTKRIRIENADTTTWPVRVTVQDKNAAGEWVDQPNPMHLSSPCQMTEQYIHSARRIVIEEREPDAEVPPAQVAAGPTA